jgi:hypothetical protein
MLVAASDARIANRPASVSESPIAAAIALALRRASPTLLGSSTATASPDW